MFKFAKMMKSPVGLLFLMGTLVVAENCDVHLSRCESGRLTRIKSGDNYSVILYNHDNTWKVFTMNNGQLEVTESSDTTPSHGKELDQQLRDSSSLEQNELTFKSEDDVSTPATTDSNSTELQRLISVPLLGEKFSSESGRLMIDSSNGNKWALKSENGQHVLYGDPEGNTMAALNLDEKSKYSNILLQNGALATFIDKQCQLVTLPMNKLSYDQVAEVGNLKRRASQDNNHGRRPDMPPPPPPRPFGPFTPPFQQKQQPGENQGSFFQPLREFLRTIPYRGFQRS